MRVRVAERSCQTQQALFQGPDSILPHLVDPLDAPHRLRQQLRRRPLPLLLRLPPAVSCCACVLYEGVETGWIRRLGLESLSVTWRRLSPVPMRVTMARGLVLPLGCVCCTNKQDLCILFWRRVTCASLREALLPDEVQEEKDCICHLDRVSKQEAGDFLRYLSYLTTQQPWVVELPLRRSS
jgi:hypothetical protein